MQWMQLPYWRQWDDLVKSVVSNGMPVEFAIAVALHWAWACVQWAVIFTVTFATADGQQRSHLLLRNAFLFHNLMEFLAATGMTSGPMCGHIAWPFPYTRYRFTQGTLKEPFLACLGDTRTAVDVAISVAFVVCLVLLMITPEPGWLLCSWPCCFFVVLVSDFSAYVGSLGCWYGPVSVIFGFAAVCGDLGQVAALQCVLILLYVGCGLGKMGPWFVGVFVAEWTQPPVFAAKRAAFQRLFFKDPDNENWSPSRLAHVLGYTAAITEWAVPLLFFLTPSVLESLGLGPLGQWPVHFATFTMCSMHVYIVLHMPIGDVTMLNTVPMLWCIYAFHIRSTGFDFAGFAAMPAGLRLFLALLAALVAFGQRHPSRVCYQTCYRFWAGNWPQAWYVFSDAGVAKMRKVRANLPLESLLDSLPATCIMWNSQLCARIFPALLHRATSGQQLHTLRMAWGMQLSNYCLGSATNCSLRCKELNPRLQRHCGFEAGEATCIMIDSFPSFGHSLTWEIIDLGADSVVASGTLRLEEMQAITKPSDCQVMAIAQTPDGAPDRAPGVLDLPSGYTDPQSFASQILDSLSLVRSWDQNAQMWLVQNLMASDGASTLIHAMVEHHAQIDGSDPSRLFPGATDAFKQQVTECLTRSDFSVRLKMQFPEVFRLTEPRSTRRVAWQGRGKWLAGLVISLLAAMLAHRLRRRRRLERLA